MVVLASITNNPIMLGGSIESFRHLQQQIPLILKRWIEEEEEEERSTVYQFKLTKNYLIQNLLFL